MPLGKGGNPHRELLTSWREPSPEFSFDYVPKPIIPWKPPPVSVTPSSIAAVIEAANKAAEEKLRAEKAAKEATDEKEAKRRKRKEEREERKKKESADPEAAAAERAANKEKRLQKLIGAVVVKTMSKYSKQMSHDVFKKHAKEVSSYLRHKVFKCCSDPVE